MCGDSIRVVHPLFFQVEGGGSIPTSPLQLNIGEINLDTAINLNSLWHSRLPDVVKSNLQCASHHVCYAAEFDGLYYACAIWTDPIARMLNGKNWLELRRLAIATDAPKNTASRMIRIMIMLNKKKWPHLVRAISYQDCDVHAGTIYAAAGWKQEHVRRDGIGWQSRNRKATQARGRKIRWGVELHA